jgi:hypothetical protein
MPVKCGNKSQVLGVIARWRYFPVFAIEEESRRVVKLPGWQRAGWICAADG